MLAGRAVVCSRAGGTLEIVDDGVTGVLVPPGNVEQAASTVAALVSDPGRRAAMGRAGRERAQREFTVAAMRRRIVEQIEQVAAE